VASFILIGLAFQPGLRHSKISHIVFVWNRGQ